MARYTVNEHGVAHVRKLIEARQYVLNSDWGEVQPRAEDENAYLERHSWEDYGSWFLGLTEGASEDTKGRYAFVFGDFRRVHRSGLIACHYRAAEWRHKDVELAAHDLLQLLDKKSGLIRVGSLQDWCILAPARNRQRSATHGPDVTSPVDSGFSWTGSPSIGRT